MTEDLKLIVTEVNKLFSSDYNLISFDSLSAESLLQILINVLCDFDALPKFEVKDLDPEETNKRIMEGLRNIQYRPNIDPNDQMVQMSEFRGALVHAEKKTVYPILRWIFDNKEKIKQVAYLAKFLIPLSLPPEAMAIPEISNLWTQYEIAMEEFKETHRTHQTSEKEGHKTRELKNDIGAIEAEIENVKKRIERTQTRLDKVPQQELFLESAHNLRIEKERQKELQLQLEEQRQGFQRATVMQERLQKELQSARLSTQGTSPEQLMEGIIEETQVLEFMVKQKLPQEIFVKQSEIQILQTVLDEPIISKEYLLELQMKVDEINKEVQQMVESRMAHRDTQNDTLAPFRQQASMVARNKEMAAEQLDQATKELRELDEVLHTKQMQLEDTVGEVILRGDELKQYVNTLRAKSSLYKQQRSELAILKSEVSDLSQTLENLKTQDPTLNASLSETITDDNNVSLDGSLSRPDSPVESRGMAELTRLVEGLSRAVTTARDRVTPMSQQLRPLRERVTDLKDERDSKKQTYDSLGATLNAEIAAIQTEITDLEKKIKKLEDSWQELQADCERAELLLEKAREELRSLSSGSENNRSSLKETLTLQIKEQENYYAELQESKHMLLTTKDERIKQLEMWTDLGRLLKIKAKSFKDAELKGPGGIILVDRNVETFTLQ